MTAAGRREWGLIAAYALLTLLAYPPFNLLFPSFVCLVPLVLLLSDAAASPDPLRQAARVGFRAGILGEGLLIYWLVAALWHFTPLSALGYVATVVIVGWYTAAQAAAIVFIWRRVPSAPRWLVVAALWSTQEWVIGHFPDIQFPWLGLGVSLTGHPMLVQWADIAGARGVGLWLAACNAALGLAILEPRRRRGLVAGVTLSVMAALGYGAWRTRTLPVRTAGIVALIQPDIGFREKWVEGESARIVGGMLAQTDSAVAIGRPDLVIWPEAAVPAPFQLRPEYARAISQLIARTHTPIVVGGLNYEVADEPGARGTYFNAAFYFDSTGAWQPYPVYAKYYLVPIVERVPFIPPAWLSGLRFFGAFGRGQTRPLYPTPVGRAGVVICFESAFEDLSRNYRKSGAEVLINITNDAWYGQTTAPGQHAAHLVMRAIETRAGIARAANSGISEVVSPLGVPSAMTRLESRAVVVTRLETSDVIPPYVRWGDWVAVLVLVLSGGLLGLAFLRPVKAT